MLGQILPKASKYGSFPFFGLDFVVGRLFIQQRWRTMPGLSRSAGGGVGRPQLPTGGGGRLSGTPCPPVHSALAEEVLIRLLPEGTQYHLSARMCPTHRQRIFQSVRDRLRAGDPLYLASTQVIEAGVDIDFPTAFRAVAHWIPSFRRTAGATGKENRQNRARLCFSPGKWYNANGHLPGGDR